MFYRLMFSALCLVTLLFGCQGQSQVRGLVDGQYLSTSRPAFAVQVRDLPLLGCEKRTFKLDGLGMMGGLGVETWIAVYGSVKGPMAVVAHADLPRGWKWDANLSQPFSVHEDRLYVGDMPFFAQTFLGTPGKNPFTAEETEDGKPEPMWVIRSFSQRFNDDTTKVILEYREPLPDGMHSLTAIPFGQSDFLKNFAGRAEKCFRVTQAVQASHAQLRTIPHLRSRYLDTRFFGTATPVGPIRLF